MSSKITGHITDNLMSSTLLWSEITGPLMSSAKRVLRLRLSYDYIKLAYQQHKRDRKDTP